jgi:hypothetical protein
MKARSLFRTKSLQDILVEVKSNDAAGDSLKRTLNVRDLTAFGIAAVVGAYFQLLATHLHKAGLPFPFCLFSQR